MKILLTDNKVKNRRLDIEESFQFSDVGVELAAEVHANLLLSQRTEHLYRLTGDMNATVVTNCDRCGKRVEFNIDHDLRYQLRLEDELQTASEYNCSEEDCEVLYLSEPVVETREILSEQLLLALPAHCLCGEACKGLCDRCGVNLNEKQCKCRETNENSPFAVLKQLQKK